MASSNGRIWWDEENKKVHPDHHDIKTDKEWEAYAKALGANFDDGTVDVEALPKVSSKLAMYAIVQQMSFGDVNTPKPLPIDFKNYLMWNAWNKAKGTSKKDAFGYFIGYGEALLTWKLCPDEELRNMAEAEVNEISSHFKDPILKMLGVE